MARQFISKVWEYLQHPSRTVEILDEAAKSDDVSDPEQSRIKLEDTEEQTGWFSIFDSSFFYCFSFSSIWMKMIQKCI